MSAAASLPDSHLNARARSRIEPRRRLLLAGAELIAEQGRAGARATDVAKAAGVAVGTLYFHFGDKDGLLEAILMEAVEHITETTLAIEAAEHASFEESVRAGDDALVRFIEQHPVRARVLFHREVQATAVGRRISELGVALQLGSLDRAAASGKVSPLLDHDVAARAIVGMLTSVLTWWAEDTSRAPRDVVVDTLTRLRLGGLHGHDA